MAARRRARRARWWQRAVVLLGSVPVIAAAATLEECRDAAAAQLPAQARAALPRIDGVPRQLLALRGYLRTRDLAERWSWDAATIAAWPGSPAQQAAEAAVARVQAAFAAQNPGYSLHVNLQVRSLDEQLRKWNGNPAVAAAADALGEAARRACSGERMPAFAAWLRAYVPARALPLAAPGLSAHGQGRAYDFQVQDAQRLVAGTDSGRVRADWVVPGWDRRLARAVHAAGDAFDGPLRAPDEPWHYRYVGAAR